MEAIQVRVRAPRAWGAPGAWEEEVQGRGSQGAGVLPCTGSTTGWDKKNGMDYIALSISFSLFLSFLFSFFSFMFFFFCLLISFFMLIILFAAKRSNE